MAEPRIQRRGEADGRVLRSAFGIAIDHPDWPIWLCIDVAEQEEVLIYGDPDAPTPRGLINHG